MQITNNSGGPYNDSLNAHIRRDGLAGDAERVNACLLDAAPELLAALKSVQIWYFRDEPEHPNSVAGQLRAQVQSAIAKAEGRKL